MPSFYQADNQQRQCSGKLDNMKNQQHVIEAKAAYTAPSIKEYGSVADLVANIGSGSFDDGAGASYAS